MPYNELETQSQHQLSRKYPNNITGIFYGKTGNLNSRTGI